jgi:hypothetical protein
MKFETTPRRLDAFQVHRNPNDRKPVACRQQNRQNQGIVYLANSN